MLLTGHKSRAIFDRYNIIHEQELLDAGDQLVEYLAQQAQAVPARRWPHTAGPAARLCAAAHARATDTNRPAIVAHAATGRADAAEHEHAPGPAAAACRKTGCHSPAQGHTRQRGVASRSPPVASCPEGEPPETRMGPTRLATLPRLAASLLTLVYSLYVRYGARVRKPTFPEQLYIDFDGFLPPAKNRPIAGCKAGPWGSSRSPGPSTAA